VAAAKKQSDAEILAAKKQRDAEILKIHEETSFDKYSGFSFFHFLLLAILVAYVVYGDFLVHGFFIRLASAAAFIFFWLLTDVIEEIIAFLREAVAIVPGYFRTAAAESTFQKAAQLAERRLQKVALDAEKRLREVTPDAQARIRHAKAHRKKAEDALQWLKAHV
jgi:hypothetical protein